MSSGTRDSDREVVLAAVQEWGLELQFASAALRADREVVLAAVQRDGLALEHASAELKADREVVLAAVLMPAFAREDRRSTLFKIFILSTWFSSDWEGMTSWINGIIPEGAATFEIGWDTGGTRRAWFRSVPLIWPRPACLSSSFLKS